MKQYDAVIIGSGQGGTPLSKKLAKAGWKTAIIEKEHAGGTCVNVGCTPTKTMIASAKMAYLMGKAESYGVQTEGYKVDMPAVIKRKDKVVESFREGSKKGLLQTENLDVYWGTASFSGKKELKITGADGSEETISAHKIFINAGGYPTIPPIDGLNDIEYYTSTTLMDLPLVPEQLLIIGGGYIGLEFGQMYQRFGSKVTVIERSDRLLKREDKDVAEAIADFLEEEGITIKTKASVTKLEKKNDKIIATIEVNGHTKTATYTHVLIAAGRTPNTKALNLQAAGVEVTGRGHIKVNSKLQTSAADIYALGDIKGGPEFTHIAYNDYIVIADNLLHGKDVSIEDRMVPYTMFTDPQLGRIGITESEAEKKGLPVKTVTLPMSRVARAIETGDTRGLMKAVVAADSGKILGAAILGAEGGEVMSVLQMAIMGGITWQQIKDTVFAHPLYTESLNNLFMKLDKEEE